MCFPAGTTKNPPAAHALVVDDVYIRNVPTGHPAPGAAWRLAATRSSCSRWRALCIGHLGHLHHPLEPEHYAAIGRLDVVMVPIDGGMTLSLPAMSEIARRLQSSIVLPMHRFSTPIAQFVAMLDERFAVEFRDSPSTKNFDQESAAAPDRSSYWKASDIFRSGQAAAGGAKCETI